MTSPNRTHYFPVKPKPVLFPSYEPHQPGGTPDASFSYVSISSFWRPSTRPLQYPSNPSFMASPRSRPRFRTKVSAPVWQAHPPLPTAPSTAASRLSPFLTSPTVPVTNLLSLCPKHTLLCPASRYGAEPNKHLFCEGAQCQALSVEGAGREIARGRGFSSWFQRTAASLPVLCKRPRDANPPLNSSRIWLPAGQLSLHHLSDALCLLLDHAG